MAISQVIVSYIFKQFFLQHKEQAEPPGGLDSGSKNYFRIAHHYKWALDKIFFEMKHEIAIITEGYHVQCFTVISCLSSFAN